LKKISIEGGVLTPKSPLWMDLSADQQKFTRKVNILIEFLSIQRGDLGVKTPPSMEIFFSKNI